MKDLVNILGLFQAGDCRSSITVMWMCLAGALLCVDVMFIINWWNALLTFAVNAGIFVYIHYRKPGELIYE